jgi:hypothetical protein
MGHCIMQGGPGNGVEFGKVVRSDFGEPLLDAVLLAAIKVARKASRMVPSMSCIYHRASARPCLARLRRRRLFRHSHALRLDGAEEVREDSHLLRIGLQ